MVEPQAPTGSRGPTGTKRWASAGVGSVAQRLEDCHLLKNFPVREGDGIVRMPDCEVYGDSDQVNATIIGKRGTVVVDTRWLEMEAEGSWPLRLPAGDYPGGDPHPRALIIL